MPSIFCLEEIMPHITAYLTKNVARTMDVRGLLAGIVTAVHETDPKGFPLAALRAKSVVSEQWYAADGNPDNATIHVEMHLLAGREDALLARVAANILDACEAAARPFAGRPLSLSVEFVDMTRSHYSARSTLKA